MTEQNSFEHQSIAWEPTPEIVERAQLTRFMKQTGASTFEELYQKSIANVEEFTADVLKFLDIKFDPPYEKLLDTSGGIEWAKWCVGGGLNISEMCLDRWQIYEMRNQSAVIWEGEDGSVETFSYGELFSEVEIIAAGLRAEGFNKGDAIGIHLPMVPETIILLLAINRIGAIAIPVFSGYGVDAIASRMNAVGAKALFTINDFPRRGKGVFASAVAIDAGTHCPALQKLYVIDSKKRESHREEIDETELSAEELAKLSEPEKIRYRNKNVAIFEKELEEMFKLLTTFASDDETARLREELEQKKDEWRRGGYREFGWAAAAKSSRKATFEFSTWNKLRVEGMIINTKGGYVEPTLAEDPLIILYTSGTTGKPKGIAHTHCGFPIKAAQDMAFGTDVGRGTRISWITDIGWMMGPWLIYGALINGATIILYDGAPDFPEADRMWEFCAKHKVEILGISPTLVRALATKGDELPKKHDLSRLRAFASTGEPWNPAPWWWLFEKVGDSKLPIINYSGGTEISGGILMGNPLLPIKPCSFSASCPGMDAALLDEKGHQVAPGKVGELVIRQPWIGMARGFWQEPERYLETYWSRFEHIWVHGDWALEDEDGHWYILGRSDDTLKVAGKRVGPAEIESLLVAHPNVIEAAVIGVPDELKGTAMVAFCVLTSAGSASEKELKELVAKDMGKPLAPSKIHFVSAIPKTRNAKVMRRVIRAAYLGEDAGDLSALENPGTVEEIAACGSSRRP